MNALRVNTLTALPVLQYLIADAGLHAPAITVRDGWRIYQSFLKLPAESSEDLAGFQTAWLHENPDAPVFELAFCRQLTDTAYGDLTRIVAIQFLLDDAPRALSEIDAWSSNFDSLDRFLDHVERLPEFEYALDGSLVGGDAVLYDER